MLFHCRFWQCQRHIRSLQKVKHSFKDYFFDATNRSKGVKARLHFAHLDHDESVDLGGGDGGEEGEGGVGDDGEEGGGGEADQHGQDAAKNRTSLGENFDELQVQG